MLSFMPHFKIDFFMPALESLYECARERRG